MHSLPSDPSESARAAEEARRARASAEQRAHVRRYRHVQQFTRIAFALAAVTAIALAWWLGTRLDH